MSNGRIKPGFVPTRGGDGGRPVADLSAIGAAIDRLGRKRFTFRNSAVFLSGAANVDCLPTCDPFDRAHCEKSDDRDPKIMPAATVNRYGVVIDNVPDAAPRMYHKSEYHEPAPGMRVHQEQVFDDTHERMRRIETQIGTSPAAVRTMATKILGATLRTKLRPRTRLK